MRPMGKVEPDNDAWRGKGLALAIAARTQVGPRDILALDRGAFLLCWSCSLAIGVAALAFAFRKPA